MLDEIRLEPISMSQYLKNVDSGDIKVDQAVQRDFCWGRNMMNALIYSAVSRKIYIPNLILAEEKKKNGTKQTYVIDGGQRTETLRRFRFEHYKVTKDLRSYIIPYKEKRFDENGEIIFDEYGDIDWEYKEFDLRDKTYDDLPEDLKDRFDGCPLSQAIYQDCTPAETSELVQIYNNHVSMNVSQKSLTYIGKFANEIKRIKDNNRFLKDGTALTESEKAKGIWERIISECVMAVNHIDEWKKQPQKMCEYLNNHSSKEEYKNIEKYFNRLNPYIDKLKNKEISDLFSPKNIAVWMMVFDSFTKLHIPDVEFFKFLNAFVNGLDQKKINDVNWAEIDSEKHTKDKSLLLKKANYIETLMNEFLHINEEGKAHEETENMIVEEVVAKSEEDSEEVPVIDFVRKNVKPDVDEEDLDLYYEMLDKDYDIDKTSKLLDWQNEPSLIGIIAYSFEQDIKLNEWIKDFFLRNSEYIRDQKENYLHMKYDLEKYLSEREEHK